MKEIEYYCLQVPDFVHLCFLVPAPLRAVFWFLTPYGFRVRSCIKGLKRFIIPEIRRSIDAWRETGPVRDQYTLLGAILGIKERKGQINRDPNAMGEVEEERQIDIFSDEVIFTAFDSAGPVAYLVTQLLFEAVSHKDIAEPLRDEIIATLKSGLALGRGNIISTPAWLIHNDEDNYPNAQEFDPYRFYDPKSYSVTTKATTASNKFLAYGYGSQMCPGRYLGVRMTQILFAKMLMRYDVELEPRRKTRPENEFMRGQVLPPYLDSIVLKNRE